MSVKPHELTNRAEGLEQTTATIRRIGNKEPKEPEPADPAPAPEPEEEPITAAFAKFRQRLAAARDLKAPPGVIDNQSWYMGKAAALNAIDDQG